MSDHKYLYDLEGNSFGEYIEKAINDWAWNSSDVRSEIDNYIMGMLDRIETLEAELDKFRRCDGLETFMASDGQPGIRMKNCDVHYDKVEE